MRKCMESQTTVLCFKASTSQNLTSKIYPRYHKGVGYIMFCHWDLI